MKRSVGLGLVVVVAAVAVGAYAFTASNTIADGGQAGVGSTSIAGYTVSNVTYTQDSTDPSKWSFVNFDLSADATQVQIKLDDSNGLLSSSGWRDCTAGSSTIQHSSPWHVHCELSPIVDSSLDTLTVAASR